MSAENIESIECHGKEETKKNSPTEDIANVIGLKEREDEGSERWIGENLH